jgi:hypothetical protein
MGGEAERIRVGGAARCPFCHDGLEKTAEVVACAPCGARFHQACLQANDGRCPACGATEVLMPPRPRSTRRRDPPAGSKIAVAREDDRTRFSWDPRTGADTFLMWLFLLMIFTAPLAWLWWRARKHTTAEVVLGDEVLEFDVVNPNTLKGSRVRVRREEVGAVRVSAAPGGQHYALTIDVGIERHKVMTGFSGAALTPPEMEWLAAEIQAWVAGG